MIDHRIPKDWRDLQNKVAQILKESGFEVEVERTVKTVRGSVEIDVFALDKTQSPEMLYLCECKHWDTPVPQTIIHSFRTVMADYGANVGLIISKKGFQSGAEEAVERTNIKLVNWFDFQRIFENRWLHNFAEYLYELVVPLVDYSEPINGAMAREAESLSQEDQERFHVLQKKYFPFASLGVMLKFLPQVRDYPIDFAAFPITLDIPGVTPKEINSYRDFGEYYAAEVPKALAEFDAVLKKNVRLAFRRSKIHEMFTSFPEIAGW